MESRRCTEENSPESQETVDNRKNGPLRHSARNASEGEGGVRPAFVAPGASWASKRGT